jgi:fructuronate reductase
MLRLDRENICDASKKPEWISAGVSLPSYDIPAVAERTVKNPRWLHFGVGNIFRSFIARLIEGPLGKGSADTGIIAAETFDYDVVDKIYIPYDNLALSAGLRADGSVKLEAVAPVAEAIRADLGRTRLAEIFRSMSLQLVSFTITEKGYSLTDMQGEFTQPVKEDLDGGPGKACHVMTLLTSLLYERFGNGAVPVALVSMDNCSRNGERLRGAVLEIAKGWNDRGFVGKDFISYLEDENRVSFPWSMIDKITPRPSDIVRDILKTRGIIDIDPIMTPRGTFIAPFANAEIPQYLVIEDKFPAGRPPLEGDGVYFVDRETVNKAEKMKVATCLNPLHTALAICGCLMGYKSISSEMSNPTLKMLVERIGYTEGMPVAVNPGIFKPEDFLREVLEERLPNPFIPDTPQRIATDTSQKIPIRFGGTINAYIESPDLDPKNLVGIPLAIAAWFRYLLGTDDRLKPMELSGDPMLPELQKGLAGITADNPESYKGQLRPFLSNKTLFVADLMEIGLGDKIEDFFVSMLKGEGSVKDTLQGNL